MQNQTHHDASWQAAIIDASSDAIISMTIDGDVLTWNPGAERMFGYHADEIVGQSVKLLTPPAYQAELTGVLARVRAGEHIVQHETIRMRARTAVFDASLTISPIRDDMAMVVRIAAIVQDITERKRREANLQFLADVSADFEPLSSVDEIMTRVGDRLARHLYLSRVAFSVVDDNADRITAVYEWRRDKAAPSVLGEHRISTLLTDAGRQHYVAGKLAVIPDTRDNWMLNAPPDLLYKSGNASIVDAPYVENGRWKFLLTVVRSEAGPWDAHDTDLIAELAARIYVRVERARAEEALARSEEKYRTLFSSIDEGFSLLELIFDGKGKVVDYWLRDNNPMYERMTGLRDAVGKRIKEILPNLEPEWLEKVESVYYTGESVRFEYTVDQLGQWYTAYLSRVGGEGSPFVAAVFDNITERKRTEANLAFLAEVSQDLVRLTNIEATMDALGAKIGEHFNAPLIAFAEVDEAQEVVTVNGAWNRPDLPSLRGVYRIQDFLTEEFGRASRAGEMFVIRDTANDPRSDAEALATINVVSIINVPLLRDGRWRFQMTVMDAVPRDWTEDEIALARELTTRIWTRLEHARAEEALAKSEERLRSLIENLPGGAVFVLDHDLRYVIAEGEALATAGLRSDDLVGHTLHEALPPELAAQYTPLYRRALAGEPFEHEHDAHQRTFLSRGVPLRAANGAVYAVLAVSYDITDRKQGEAERERLLHAEHAARAEAEAALQTRDQFLSVASHELRTPLTSLVGYAHMLQMPGMQNTDTVQRMTDRIVRQTQRLNALIEQLLDVSRLQRGQFSLTTEPVNLAAVVGEVVDEVRATLPTTTHQIEFTAPHNPVLIAGDGQRLHQVIHNLLTNAVKYSPAGGLVHATVRRTAMEAVVEVRDEGIGIPQEVQARLFEPFYRAPNVGGQVSGFGLGLHIVREIVLRHGGRIEVESAEGQGSTFRVFLPLRDALFEH